MIVLIYTIIYSTIFFEKKNDVTSSNREYKYKRFYREFTL